MTIAELKTAIALAETLDHLPEETRVVVRPWGGDVQVESAEDPDTGEWVLVIRG